MNSSDISKQTGIAVSHIELLLDGVSKEMLHWVLSVELGAAEDSAIVDTARMNIIGCLRSHGYEVSGGRKGRGQLYQITGLAEVVSTLTAESWTGAAREVLDTIEGYLPVDDDSAPLIRAMMSQRSSQEMVHELTWLSFRSYELARSRGFLVIEDRGQLAIVKRFENAPRFKVFFLDGDPLFAHSYATWLSKASLVPVVIMNLSSDHIQHLKSYDRRGTVSGHIEAIHRCKDIVDNPRQFFSGTEWATIRKHQSTITHDDRAPVNLQTRVIDEWRKTNEPKQRQLAITRDFIGIQSGEGITLTGMRGSDPVYTFVLERLANRLDVAAEMVGKALNYKTQPGGAPGTFNYALYDLCRYLLEIDIPRLNRGSYLGGNAGLADYKRRFARPEDDVTSWTFTPSCPHLTREEITA